MNKDAKKRRWKHTSWEEEERQALLDLGLIEFVPAPDLGPGTSRREKRKKALEPHGRSSSRRKIPASRKANRPDKGSRRKLGTEPTSDSRRWPNQLQCLSRWAGIPVSLWQQGSWWESMVVLYGQSGKLSYKPLGKDKVEQLDRKVSDLRKLKKKGVDLTNPISEIVVGVIGEHSSGVLSRVLASKYLRLRVDKPIAKDCVLPKLYQDPGTWERIAEEWSRIPPTMPAASTRPSKEQFLLYLTPPQGSYLELVGRVLYNVMGERFRIRASSRPEKMRNPQAYRWVCDRYVDALRIPDDGLQRIPLIYRIAWLEEYGMAIQATRRHVFLAARALSELDEQVYCAHLNWIRVFQHRVFSRYLIVRPAERSSQYWVTTLRTHRQTLQNDVLLNSVFHNEVLRGWKWLEVLRDHGGQPLPAEGITVAHAVKQLMRDLPKPARPRVSEVLEGCPADMRHIIPSGEDADKRDVYTYTTPLMNALIRGGQFSYPFTSESVRGTYNRYRKDSKLARFAGDLHKELRRINEWIWSLQSLP